MTKRKYVDVTVSWCYGECSPTAKVPLEDWQQILRGTKVSTFAGYWYEGAKYNALFNFNYKGPGTLYVTYDDGGEGFIGHIWEADILGGEYPDPDDQDDEE